MGTETVTRRAYLVDPSQADNSAGQRFLDYVYANEKFDGSCHLVKSNSPGDWLKRATFRAPRASETSLETATA